jgi:hypothetical protein
MSKYSKHLVIVVKTGLLTDADCRRLGGELENEGFWVVFMNASAPPKPVGIFDLDHNLTEIQLDEIKKMVYGQAADSRS